MGDEEGKKGGKKKKEKEKEEGREREEIKLSGFSLSYSSGTPAYGMMLPTFWVAPILN